MAKKPKSNRDGSTPFVVGSTHPEVESRPVTCGKVLARERVFIEAHRQGRPLVDSDSPHARRVAKLLLDGNANPRGIRQETAMRQATTARAPADFTQGANPTGKLAEVVAVADYRELHHGRDPGIVNSPKHVARNVRDIHIAPDTQSRKDLIFGFETPDGRLILKYNGQVKTGAGQYVSESLVKMAKTPGYGKVGYVDSRYVNADGSPRIAPDAFTPGQARKLQEAGVQLRGIPDLEQRATRLGRDLSAHEVDGLSPHAREELRVLQSDIAKAYKGRAVAGRVAGGAAIGAVSAAVASLVVQLATNGEVEVSTVKGAAAAGAAYGAGGAAADAALYHGATKALDLAPEAAKTLAQNGVAVGFCVVAVGLDVRDEMRQFRAGEVDAGQLTTGVPVKTALNILPLVLAPLGLPAVPLLIGAQVGGRWLIAKARERDSELALEISTDMDAMDDLHGRLDDLAAECDATDALFAEALSTTTGGVLRLVK